MEKKFTIYTVGFPNNMKIYYYLHQNYLDFQKQLVKNIKMSKQYNEINVVHYSIPKDEKNLFNSYEKKDNITSKCADGELDYDMLVKLDRKNYILYDFADTFCYPLDKPFYIKKNGMPHKDNILKINSISVCVECIYSKNVCPIHKYNKYPGNTMNENYEIFNNFMNNLILFEIQNDGTVITVVDKIRLLFNPKSIIDLICNIINSDLHNICTDKKYPLNILDILQFRSRIYEKVSERLKDKKKIDSLYHNIFINKITGVLLARYFNQKLFGKDEYKFDDTLMEDAKNNNLDGKYIEELTKINFNDKYIEEVLIDLYYNKIIKMPDESRYFGAFITGHYKLIKF